MLGTLQTISAWRGHIVDKTIETFVVPTLNGHRNFLLKDLLAHARQLFERQLAFGLAHRVREKGMTKEKANGEFAAFLAVENGLPGRKDIAELEAVFHAGLSGTVAVPIPARLRWCSSEKCTSANFD